MKFTLRLAPVMSSEEKRTETRKEIMENESIFSPSKSTNSNSLSDTMNKSGKAQKIVEFKKVYNLINISFQTSDFYCKNPMRY